MWEGEYMLQLKCDNDMKKIVLLEPSISSLNMGDYIIVESVKKELEFLLNGAFIIEQPTQTPIMHFYQRNDNRLVSTRESDYKFVCGSNLIWHNMLNPNSQWNYNVFNCCNIEGAILVGVGSSTTRTKVNLYTKMLYNKVLNKNYIHSVRDEATKKRLESIGIKAINTGCATMWSLTESHCNEIPQEKADKVVFTLTDYCKNKDDDRKFVDILCKNYNDVYFWPQGSNDYNYAMELCILDKVKILNPDIESLRKLLISGNIDYIGTRLHGGIFAMQNKVRTIILIVDNRAREIKDDYSIPAIERSDIYALEKMINSNWRTTININEDRINLWKAQFK